MPIYEYICNDCGQAFDKLISTASSTAKVACPNCDSKKTLKQLSTINVGSSTPDACKACPSAGPSHGCPSGGMCSQFYSLKLTRLAPGFIPGVAAMRHPPHSLRSAFHSSPPELFHYALDLRAQGIELFFYALIAAIYVIDSPNLGSPLSYQASQHQRSTCS